MTMLLMMQCYAMNENCLILPLYSGHLLHQEKPKVIHALELIAIFYLSVVNLALFCMELGMIWDICMELVKMLGFSAAVASSFPVSTDAAYVGTILTTPCAPRAVAALSLFVRITNTSSPFNLEVFNISIQ